MNDEISLVSTDKQSSVKIYKGELTSYHTFNEEFIHQKEDAGWNNSDTEMFPIIGPTELNNYKVSTPKGDGIQAKHGLLRALEYVLLENTQHTVSYQKKYLANTPISNPKFPDKSLVEMVFWPYDFSVTKKYKLTDACLFITFEIVGEAGMPFMFGYHPAFKTMGNAISFLQVNGQKINLKDILNAGADAYPMLNTEKVTLVKNNNVAIDIETKGFENCMCWTEVETMVCIEPITQYPDLARQEYSEKNMRVLNDKALFKVKLRPYEI